jgi:hypothetical protein
MEKLAVGALEETVAALKRRIEKVTKDTDQIRSDAMKRR